MAILIFILELAVSAFILNVLYRQSRNVILFISQRPYSWMMFVCCLGLIWFFIGSFFGFSFNMVWLAASFTFVSNLTPQFSGAGRKPDEESKELSKTYGAVFRTKSGLAAFATGCALGWLLFWGEYCSDNRECHRFFWS